MADEVNKGHRQVTAALEKALADEAYERRLAAMREKALADEVNKQRRQVTAAWENALANDAYERRYQESANMLPPPTALLRIKMRCSLPWGGAFARSL